MVFSSSWPTRPSLSREQRRGSSRRLAPTRVWLGAASLSGVPVSTITFAAPMVGIATWAEAYDAAGGPGSTTIRVVKQAISLSPQQWGGTFPDAIFTLKHGPDAGQPVTDESVTR